MIPVMLDVKEKEVVIIGGGKVALRKIQLFLNYKANITVVSEKFESEILKLEGKIDIISSTYNKRFIEEAFMVIAATSDKKINHKIYEDAKKLKKFVNVVDDYKNSDFVTMAIVERGPLKIAVSTSGESAGASKKIKKKIEDFIPSEYEELIKYIGIERKKIIETYDGEEKERRLLKLLEKLDRRDDSEGSSRN